MSTSENGSLGLTKKSILERLNTKVADVSENVDLKTGLTDAQVGFVKTRLTAAENLVSQAQAAFVTVNARLASLETKATQAATKFTSLDFKIAAIEARLTAHQI